MHPNEYAFPKPDVVSAQDGRVINGFDGIDVRTYIATKAMEGLLANPEYGSSRAEIIAKYAVEQADALIAELNKPVTPA